MLKVFVNLIVFLAILSIPRWAIAAYVLPYPSYMPGNKLYRVSRFMDEAKRCWYWGNLASYRYYLGQSDKTLVEAKTLFEYGQYLLAMQAIRRSGEAIEHANQYFQNAKREQKIGRQQRQELSDAMSEHIRVLSSIRTQTPEEFYWSPEKESSQTLRIHQELDRAIGVREDMLSKL